MRRISFRKWAATAVAGASLLAIPPLRAEAADAGAVRITDSASTVPAGAVNATGGSYTSGSAIGYGGEACPSHSASGCLPWCGHGVCHPWCCQAVCHPLACLHGGLHSYIAATQGLAAGNPIYRLPVHYQRYWPTQWYGQPGAVYAPIFPMVYMPTDTTQLGFYYQRVPYWQPRPGLLPPAPGAGLAGGVGGFGAFGAAGYGPACDVYGGVTPAGTQITPSGEVISPPSNTPGGGLQPPPAPGVY